jgi:MFS superfamily sulfate permease-like transporter
MDPGVITAAIALAFIASAETLLSAAAVDRMHDGVRTNYNKELRAQGIGNLLCGVAGALPMTGVIVRSSANVQAGAQTRLSAILHGAWILGFVALLPWLLREIPMAALGAVLVVTGAKLVNLKHVRHLFAQYGLLPAAIWAVTFVLVIATDLLTGVLVGLALSVLELLPNFRRLRLKVDAEHGEDAHKISLDGAATFVMLPKLNSALDAVPGDKPVHLAFEKVPAIDHTSAETLRDWVQRRRARGLKVHLTGDPDQLRKLQPA